DARSHAVRVEDLEVVQVLAGGGEHHWLAGDRSYRQRGTATGIAIELGEHDTGEVHAFMESLGGVDRVLADHRIDDEEHFIRVDGGADVRGLGHHLGVHAQAAGGIHDDDVMQLGLGLGDTVAGYGYRIPGGGVEFRGDARVRCVDRNAGAFAVDLQLLDCVGTLEVTGHQHRGVALSLQVLGQLAGQGGLAGTLQAGEHDHRWRVLGQVQAAGFATEDANEFLVDDLDDLLARVQRLGNLGAQGAFLHLGYEAADHRYGNVGVKQGATDLACGTVDIRFSQAALAAQVLEGCCQAIGK